MKKPILTSALSLIDYRPGGGDMLRTCAAIWEESGQVRLLSPFLRKRSGILDPQPSIKEFPCAGGSVEPFERAMEWLDSVCYAAQTCAQVFQACQAQAEWGIECVRYDASDRTLGLGGLGKPLVTDKALQREVARQCLLQTIKRLLKDDPAFASVHMNVLEPDSSTGDVATVAFASGKTTRVCLLKKVSSTDVIRRGILAMDRMAQPTSNWQHALLIMPGLVIARPMFLSKNVTICSLDFSLVHLALQAQLLAQH